jgi:hypothetical protein
MQIEIRWTYSRMSVMECAVSSQMAKITYSIDGELPGVDVGTNSYIQLRLRQMRRKIHRLLRDPLEGNPEFYCKAEFDDGSCVCMAPGHCHVGPDKRFVIDSGFSEMPIGGWSGK